MPAKYVCPAALRKNIHPFLMCSLELKDGVDYNLRENARDAVCVRQHYCPCTKREENTAEYKECYEAKTKPAPIEEIPQPEEEIKPKTTKGKSRKTAKN